MTTSRTARAAAAVAVATLTLTATGIAGAQESPAETTVTTEVTSGTRTLWVTDLTGATLTDLALEPNSPEPFVVRVRDQGFSFPTGGPTGFHVESTLNNLYRTEDGGLTHNFATAIPSSAVTVDYPTTKLGALDNMLDLSPDGVLSSVPIDCASVGAILGFNGLLDAVRIAADPLCGLLSGITGSAITVADVALNADIVRDVDVSSLAPELLPVGLDPNDLDTGAYAVADCGGKIGKGDTACTTTTPTRQVMLRGTAITNAIDGFLPDTLTSLIGLLAPEVQTATGTVADAVVVASLQEDARYGDLVTALSGYSTAELTQLVDGLFTVVPTDVSVEDIVGLTGSYLSFPRLTVAPTDTTAGEYQGTMTLTLVND